MRNFSAIHYRNYLVIFFVLLLSCAKSVEIESGVEPESYSWQIEGFEKVDSLNPILEPSGSNRFYCPLTKDSVAWEARNVLNPSAVVKDGRVYLFYRAQDSLGTSRIGLAVSEDGLHFDKMSAPVFYPERDTMYEREWNYRKRNSSRLLEECKSCYFDGVEDPRIMEDSEGTYWMTYTAYDGKLARLSLASSTDLLNWTKHGLVLKEAPFEEYWSKSGAIIGELKDDRVVASRVDGKFWMYFGDTDLFLAYSKDLVNWTPAMDEENGKLISVMNKRKGYFDSRLVEPGPYALKTEQGILLIYNGSNAANFNDPELPRFTYSAGQALFDGERPYKLIRRSEDHFIHPEKEYEKRGEVNEVCFVEGLVHFKDKWYLYYGTGDSKIAVAVSEKRLPGKP